VIYESEPVVEESSACIPHVLSRWRCSVSSGNGGIVVPEARLSITICSYSSAMAEPMAEVILRMGRIAIQFAANEAQHLPFVLLQQAVVVHIRDGPWK